MRVGSLRENYPDPAPLFEMTKKVGEVAQKEGSPFTTLSWLYTQLTPEERDLLFAEVPYLVKLIFFPMFTWIYFGYWKYSKTTN